MTEIEGKHSFISIGDPHFKSSTQKETDYLIKNSLEFCRKEKPGFIVILGDVINVSGVSKSFVYQQGRAFSWILDLSVIATVVVLIGNHDMSDINKKFCKEHSFQGFENDNVLIVDEPTIVTVTNSLTKLKFLALPYMTPGTFMEEVQKHMNSDIRVVFAHQELKGASLGSGFSCKVSESWPSNHPLLISGHIHNRQKIANNFLYQGTPYTVNFGESGEKVISYFDYDNKLSTFKEKTFCCVPLLKVKKVVSTSDLIDLEKKENIEYRLIIQDKKNKIQLFKSSLDYLTIKNDFPNIEFIVLREDKEYTSKPFLEEITERVDNIKSLKILWEQIIKELQINQS